MHKRTVYIVTIYNFGDDNPQGLINVFARIDYWFIKLYLS